MKKKMQQRILLAVLLFAFIAGGFSGLFGNIPGVISEADAAGEGYSITRFSVDAVVHEDATLDITEQIQVYFTEPRHGIYRDIPLRLKVNREVDGKVKSFLYRVKVSDVQVEGARYELENEGSCRRIILGDENQIVSGDQIYTIRYRLDMGDDRISEYDELFYNLIGDGWSVPTDTVNFSVTFEKEADISDAHIYVGAFGEKEEGRAEVSISGNRIEGTVAEGLRPNEAVSVFLRLPEGYFAGTRTESPLPAAILAGILFLLTVYSVIRYFRKRQKRQAVETVEFYPPEGLSSAEVGYIIDNRADQKDIISLLFWLAHNGYLTISGGKTEKGKKEEEFILHKQKDISSELPMHIQIFFNGLFRKKDDLRLKKVNKHTAEAVADAQKALPSYFIGKRKLSNGKVMAVSLVLCLLAAVLTGAGIGAACAFLSEGSYILMTTIMIVLGIFSVLLASIAENGAFTRRRTRVAAKAVMLILVGAGCAVGMVSALYAWLVPVFCLCGTISIWTAAATQAPTDYKIDVTGKLLGFRRFIETAELERLELLVEEDPDYFYDVLPYAYVFGLTDTWAKKFETIALEPPQWWEGNGMMHPYMMRYFIHNMQHCADQFGTQVYKAIEPSKGTYTSSGGGGYSGGGFGGGGGSSW